MLLLDEVLAATKTHARSRVTIGPDSSFFSPGLGVPGWIALEYMAQTVGLIAGMDSLEKGAGVPVGFLLGTRKLTCDVPWFAAGDQLEIRAEESLVDVNGLAAYNCNVSCSDVELARGRLTVYRTPLESVAIKFHD